VRRILALVGEAYGAGGGIAQYNRDFFDALSAACAYEVRIRPRGGPAEASTPRQVGQDRPVFDRRAYGLGVLAVALRQRPEAVFCGHLYMAPLAHLICVLTGARLIVQLHGIEGWSAPGRAVLNAVGAADLVLCVSRDTRTRLLGWSRLPPERAVVVANTVREAFQPGDRQKARARWSLGEAKVLLSVGRLDRRERYKGQDRVIAALTRLKDQGLTPIYLIAGDGDDQPRLEALARSAGVADQVRFLGHVADADLPDLYRAADLFVLPSTGEGFGIVYLEAMACGTPALGLTAGGAPDALGEGELGTLASEADLAGAIAEQLQAGRDPGLAAEVRRRFGQAVFRAQVQAQVAALFDPPAAERMAA
jgi:phosphatidylinositol alpha-1,6-mannosyltransferase